MPFPDPQGFRLVVAAADESGEAVFLEVDGPAVRDVPGVSKSAYFWAVEGGHSGENFGRVPSRVEVAGPNGSTFGVMCFPARSAGKLIFSKQHHPTMKVGHGGDPAMHATDTIDYEVIISGRADIELPGGKVRTLGPGDLLVMAGVPHAWKNRYDEDCVFVVVTIGYNQDQASAPS